MTDTPKLMTDERLAEIKAARDAGEPVELHQITLYAVEPLDHIDALTAELAEARRTVCNRAAYGRPGHESEHDFDTPEDAAREFGWGYLYPEPAAPTVAEAIDPRCERDGCLRAYYGPSPFCDGVCRVKAGESYNGKWREG
jgi:hypothetical protein